MSHPDLLPKRMKEQTKDQPQTLLIALSGPSCSGKTTLARLLRDALQPHAFILHEDDFYKTDAEIPVKKVADGRELQDWDCLESLDLHNLQEMLAHIKEEGTIKDGFDSKEDRNAVGEVRIEWETVKSWKDKFSALLAQGSPATTRIAIIDGFLLFSEEMQDIRNLFDVRLLLRLDYDTVKSRRERRMGYVTLEGFWQDPEGYVDLIVWPNYIKDHAFLFEDGNVDGELKEDLCRRLDIHGMPKAATEDMTMCFEWAAGIVHENLTRLKPE